MDISELLFYFAMGGLAGWGFAIYQEDQRRKRRAKRSGLSMHYDPPPWRRRE